MSGRESTLAKWRSRLGRLWPRMMARDGPLTRSLALARSQLVSGLLPEARRPDRLVSSICGYCSTGCSLDIHVREDRAVNITPTPQFPVNLGTACPKGWEALQPLAAADRATVPLLRRHRSAARQPVGWDTALGQFCGRIRDIQQRHGAASVAFLGTGQMPTEELALLGALAKFEMGLLHGDGNTRQCMATAVTAYKESFGFDAPPYTYDDLEHSDVIVLVGSNLCIAHPILWGRVARNPHAPAIIVVDPRRTETAMAATLHLPLRPKSDLTLFYGLAYLLIRGGAVDAAFVAQHTTGFDEFVRHVEQFPPQRVARETGLPLEQLLATAALLRGGKRVSFWWTMGVNQSYQGTRTAQSLINLALMTGNIGRPGTGANAITGQCNAMGSRLFANTTNLLGGRDFTSAEHRRQVADTMQLEECQIPQQNSWPYDRILEGILRGEIKGLWVVATNPAHSWINQNMLRDVLDRLEFLVVQDMYHSTETAELADLLLPAAGWGEKDGTFINSERRIASLRQFAGPPGQALSDFDIFHRIAESWGCAGKPWLRAWHSPQAVFQQLRELTRGRPCDFTGIRDYQMLDARGGVQWPYAEDSPSPPAPQRRLFADGRFYHADGRAKFVFEVPREMPEPPTAAYPFLLLTGRGTTAQWHTQTRTSKSSVLRKLYPAEPFAEIHPDDARHLGIRPNQPVIIESQRGRVRVRAHVTRAIARGQIFLSMHNAATNRLTLAHFDPYSRQPSYKNCAVRLRPAGAEEDVA
jgi:anaerobic selenocysteine-containing dehydrogenase